MKIVMKEFFKLPLSERTKRYKEKIYPYEIDGEIVWQKSISSRGKEIQKVWKKMTTGKNLKLNEEGKKWFFNSIFSMQDLAQTKGGTGFRDKYVPKYFDFGEKTEEFKNNWVETEFSKYDERKVKSILYDIQLGKKVAVKRLNRNRLLKYVQKEIINDDASEQREEKIKMAITENNDNSDFDNIIDEIKINSSVEETGEITIDDNVNFFDDFNLKPMVKYEKNDNGKWVKSSSPESIKGKRYMKYLVFNKDGSFTNTIITYDAKMKKIISSSKATEEDKLYISKNGKF